MKSTNKIVNVENILFKDRDFLSLIQNDLNKDQIIRFFLDDVQKYVEKLHSFHEAFDASGKISQVLENRLFLETRCILEKGDKIISSIKDKVIRKRIKEMFRKIVFDFVKEGDLVRRGYAKPRGYAGDYEIIEMIYNNSSLSKGLGRCFDKYLLNDDYVLAIRTRKEQMKGKLSDFITQYAGMKIDILNLASGSAREIRELFLDEEFSTDKKIKFTLVDQDRDALEFSKLKLDRIPNNISFRYINENVLNFSRSNEKYTKILGCFDLIYSIGLADYIPDILLEELIKFSFNLLKAGGRLVIAHKNTRMYKSLASDWFCNWHFYPRSCGNVIKLIKSFLEHRKFDLNISNKKSGCIFFITVTKNTDDKR